MQYLVGTGADVSVIPPSQQECKHPQNLLLEAINNTSIPTYGTRSLTLNLGFWRTFCWAFIIADVRKPILGADFLHTFSLLVDVKHHQLLDGLTQLHVRGIATQDPPLSPTLQPKEPVDFAALIHEFPSVTRPCIADHSPRHDVTHYIPTTGREGVMWRTYFILTELTHLCFSFITHLTISRDVNCSLSRGDIK